jgi:hypothetical protein
MRTYNQFLRINSVLLIFLVLIESTGCYSTRTLTVSEISPSDIYLIHSGNSLFPVCNLVLTEGILTGELVTITNNNTKSIKNHIYLSFGSVVRTENNTLCVPAPSVTKIIQNKKAPSKTAIAILVPALILGSLATVGIIWGFISLMGLFQE